MSSARVVVCERMGRWAVALRRELGEAGTAIRQTRNLSDAWETLGRYPASFLVVEVDPAALGPFLGGMLVLPRDFPLARVAAVGEPVLRAYQWLLREAGVIDVVVSRRRLAPLSEAIHRHLSQIPLPQRTWTEEVWAGLPWGKRDSQSL
jgi:hypothetical protein